MKAIIFARVSSKEQEDGQSIPAQVRRLTEYALRKNLIIAETFQITESSTKDTRKQFENILHYIKKSKEPIALITDTVDRLQRSFRETPLLDELRRQGKLEMHFLREGLIINQASSNAQLMQWDMGVLFASSYVRQLGDNVKRSQEECRKNGQWISKAPYGYKNISLPSGQKSIIVNEEQAVFVRKAFTLYQGGLHSYQTVATELRAQGFAPTDRKASATARTIELILKNPFYMGMMYVKDELQRHQYPALISEFAFNEVQRVIHNHHKKPVQYAGKPILLRGFITCDTCDGTVSGYIKKGKYVYYSCHNSKRICQKVCFTEQELLGAIMPHFHSIVLTNEQITEIGDYIEQVEAQEHAVIQQQHEVAHKRSTLIRERISRLIDMHVDGTIDAEFYHLKLEEYKTEQLEVMRVLQSKSTGGKTERLAAEDVLRLAQKAGQLFISSSFDEKRQLLKFFTSNLRLTAEKLDVELREPFRTLAYSQDQHIWRD